jgi:protein-S-isoprenylcysteine O-methyltransferase Ste14
MADMTDTDQLRQKMLINVAWAQAVLAALIFIPAWSIAYWQGWLYWLCAGAGMLWLSLDVAKNDPALAKRRAHAGPTAEHRPRQKLIQSFTSVFGIAIFIVSPLDYRFGWSSVPALLTVTADAAIILGFVAIFLTFRENTFASSIIEITPEQRVVDTGPYARVRHPMYSGALLIFLGSPLALGSWWGLIPATVVCGALVWRLIDEESVLRAELPGYDAYTKSVRTRLVPGLW